ncbi:MAG: hypothetical protein IID41_07695 [Planctomycetes bacterium]|nr:hypothetical protein [Planctomycetota bacterium]
MFGSAGKYIGGKVLTAILVACVLWTSYYFYKNPEKMKVLFDSTKASLVWLGFVAALPWGLFFVPPLVVKADSNAAAAGMLGGYLVVDIFMAFWLAGWSFGGVLVWGLAILGFLLAAVYNFMVCDFLAEQAEENL